MIPKSLGLALTSYMGSSPALPIAYSISSQAVVHNAQGYVLGHLEVHEK